MTTKVKSFRLPDEAIDIIENLKEKYGKTEGEIVKDAILNTNQLVKSLQSELSKKNEEIKALYIKIGELKNELNRPIWQKLFRNKAI